MLKFLIGSFRNYLGLDRNTFIAYLVSLFIFLLVGWFVFAQELEGGTYFFAGALFVTNSVIMFALKDVYQIKVASLSFLFILNLVLFGYYYFSSLTVIF